MENSTLYFPKNTLFLKIDKNIKDNIKNDYKNGLSVNKISTKYNIKYRTLLSWKKHGYLDED
ncbi:MAG: hypothetical protein K0S67_14 [Nitrososphaeraceae archaeon]|jgi:uncharacterized protein YjcR|nr:hypothetical protein [Nitrososphaeraceae archaeon]